MPIFAPRDDLEPSPLLRRRGAPEDSSSASSGDASPEASGGRCRPRSRPRSRRRFRDPVGYVLQEGARRHSGNVYLRVDREPESRPSGSELCRLPAGRSSSRKGCASGVARLLTTALRMNPLYGVQMTLNSLASERGIRPVPSFSPKLRPRPSSSFDTSIGAEKRRRDALAGFCRSAVSRAAAHLLARRISKRGRVLSCFRLLTCPKLAFHGPVCGRTAGKHLNYRKQLG